MFLCGDVEFVIGFDLDIFLESDPTEEIDFERDMILNESLDSVADGDHVTFFNEVGVLSFEEGFG